MKNKEKLLEVLERMPPHRLEALYRVAKTRGYAFFRNPAAMALLRGVVDARLAKSGS